MKFPGKRKNKHYFPVTESKRQAFKGENFDEGRIYIVGIDQPIVDIEANVSYEYLKKYNILKGESSILSDQVVDEMYQELKTSQSISGEFAGGSVGNTLHNFCVLSEARSALLGAISKNIEVGDYAFNYICSTHSSVDFSYLCPASGAMGRALCLLTPDKERSFVIGKGIMNDLEESFIPEGIIKKASALLITAYTLRDEQSKIFKSTLKACEIAKKYDVPVVLSLGTSSLVEQKREFFLNFAKEYVSILAMNEQEAHALIQEEDSLLACEKLLDFVDMCFLTVGPKGLYIGAYTENELKRETKDTLHSKSIENYNQYEYSRAFLKKDCKEPLKIYSHINPYMGGPEKIKNTNGAGDAALAALLHDLASNGFHRLLAPESPKHAAKYLTYSSIHQICKYSNRVSFEVLSQNSPRLYKSLPSREENLEDAYWDT